MWFFYHLLIIAHIILYKQPIIKKFFDSKFLKFRREAVYICIIVIYNKIR